MKTMRQKVWHFHDTQIQIRAETDLPDGVAGRVSGVALTYEVVDSYNTLFARNCAKMSIATKVAARKVPLLMDHERRTGAHVGVVSSMTDIGDALVMTADLFDTPEGRAALEYVKAVMAANASTGFSIGFVPRKSEMVQIDGKMAERFNEIELREVSITPMPAVPGADVTGARADDAETIRTDIELLEVAAKAALDALPEVNRTALLASYGTAGLVDEPAHGSEARTTRVSTATTTTSPMPSGSITMPAARTATVSTAMTPGATLELSPVASMDARLAAVRHSYAL